MAQKTGLKSAKRFGPRYGASNKLKLALIEVQQRKLQLCPSCGKLKAKWKSVGIFECRKCATIFTSKAYYVEKKIRLRKDIQKDLTPEEIEAAQKVVEEE